MSVHNTSTGQTPPLSPDDSGDGVFRGEHPLRPAADARDSAASVDQFLRLVGSRSSGASAMSATLMSQRVSPLFLVSDVTLGSLQSSFCRRFSGNSPLAELYARRTATCPRPRIIAVSLNSEKQEADAKYARGMFLRARINRASGTRSTERSFPESHGFSVEEFRCPICLDVFDRPVVTHCRHIFCVECIVSTLVRQSVCPLCRAAVYGHSLRPFSDTSAMGKLMKDAYARFSSLVVECPKCKWVGEMRCWEDHVGTGDCAENSLKKSVASPLGSAPAPITSEDVGFRMSSGCSSFVVSPSQASERVEEPLSASLRDFFPSMGLGLGFTDTQFPSAILPPHGSTPHIESQRRRALLSAASSSSSSDEASPPTAAERFVAKVSSAERTASLASPTARASLLGCTALVSSNGVRETNGCPTETLASWLIDNDPGYVVRLYVIAHRMENTAGALGGLLYSGIYHGEAVLEFESLVADPTRSSTSAVFPQQQAAFEQQNALPAAKTFVSMEIFSDSPGVQWRIFNSFPPLKATAREISMYNCSPAVGSAVIVDYLLSCRNRRYNLVNWNCQRFIVSLRRATGISDVPTSVRSLPRPKSYSAELMTFLDNLLKLGNVPTLSSAQLKPAGNSDQPSARDAHDGRRRSGDHPNESHSSACSRSSGRLKRWGSSLMYLVPKRRGVTTQRSSLAAEDLHPIPRELPAVTAPPRLRVRSVTLCLFPAEDINRACLRPAAQLQALLCRTFGFGRPPRSDLWLQSASAAANPSATRTPDPDTTSYCTAYSSEGWSETSVDPAGDRVNEDPSFAFEANELDNAQVRMRCQTFPILLFEVQTSCWGSATTDGHSSSSRDKWETLGYLSLEFRSDHGLWWHWYPEYPPGLRLVSMEEGGTNVVLSSRVSFSLEELRNCLDRVKDREYHPTRWAGWDFAEVLLRTCCPSVAPHLLILPVAESLA